MDRPTEPLFPGYPQQRAHSIEHSFISGAYIYIFCSFLKQIARASVTADFVYASSRAEFICTTHLAAVHLLRR